jgi:diguanylate cyclase (GGDEF)-like protein
MTSWARGRLTAAVVAIATLLIGGVAYYLLDTQASSRSQLRAELGHRAALAANLTGATIAADVGNPSDLAPHLGVPASELGRVLGAMQGDSGDPLAAILDARGRVLAAWPPGRAALAGSLGSTPDVRRALRVGSALSDLAFFGAGRTPVLRFSVAVSTPFGRRAYIDVSSPSVIGAAATYLASAPAVAGAHAYLLDGGGRVLASSPSVPQGLMLPDARLLQAIARHRTGDLGGSYYVTAPIGASTNWRVVFSVSRSALFAPLSSSRMSDWLLFIAFVVSVMALLVVAGLAFRKSAQLTGAREREQAAQRLAHERLHDALTGLPNRALFLDRTAHALQRIERTGWPLAVLFVDLDHFKRINDSLGHGSGDELLTLCAHRLRDAIRPSDTISRFGGDEFLILCEELVDNDDAMRVASRIRGVLDEPFTVGERKLHVSCCIGVAIHTPGRHPTDAATMVRDADAAMYNAKESGRGRVKVFDEELHRDAVRRLDTEVALRDAIGAGQLEVHYQPIVELPSGKLSGVEALARWTRPDVGPVSPLEFIGLAEECGLIDEIGEWVLSTAMATVQDWHGVGLVDDDFSLSVNVSPRQLANPAFPGVVISHLDGWSPPPASLCLEITESAVVGDPEAIERALLALSEFGIKLAIDDFGIGQSSLEQLVHSLPVDILKLDRAFVADMDQTRERAVVAAVAPMAADLGMAAIAEGVETADQATKLAALGYPLAQGYHFGRPVDAAHFRRCLAAPGYRRLMAADAATENVTAA